MAASGRHASARAIRPGRAAAAIDGRAQQGLEREKPTGYPRRGLGHAGTAGQRSGPARRSRAGLRRTATHPFRPRTGPGPVRTRRERGDRRPRAQRPECRCRNTTRLTEACRCRDHRSEATAPVASTAARSRRPPARRAAYRASGYVT